MKRVLLMRLLLYTLLVFVLASLIRPWVVRVEDERLFIPEMRLRHYGLPLPWLVAHQDMYQGPWRTVQRDIRPIGLVCDLVAAGIVGLAASVFMWALSRRNLNENKNTTA